MLPVLVFGKLCGLSRRTRVFLKVTITREDEDSVASNDENERHKKPRLTNSNFWNLELVKTRFLIRVRSRNFWSHNLTNERDCYYWFWILIEVILTVIQIHSQNRSRYLFQRRRRPNESGDVILALMHSTRQDSQIHHLPFEERNSDSLTFRTRYASL